MNIQIA